MSKPISQAEARRLRRRVRQLEEEMRLQRHGYGLEWPNGETLMSVSKDECIAEEELATVRTAQRLGHPVLVRVYQNTLHFYGWR